jgi:hypothetical protein
MSIRIAKFNLAPGYKIGGKYRVEAHLGGGYEGEVYRVTEIQTGIRRAGKLFYPQRNARDHTARVYARRLDRLRDCPIVIQYHHAERVVIQNASVTCLISEYVDGILLSDFLAAHRGRRMPPFKALHVLYLHTANILVRPRGIFFDAKVVDFYNLGQYSVSHRRDDVVDLIHLLYEMTGGRRHYAAQPPAIKGICRGLRRDLIGAAFPTAGHLRRRLESEPGLAAV